MRERQKKLKRLWSWLLSSIWLTSAPLYGGMIFIWSLKPRPWSFDFFLAVPYDGPFTLLSIKRKETDQSRKLFLGPSDKLRGQKLFGHPFSGNFKAVFKTVPSDLISEFDLLSRESLRDTDSFNNFTCFTEAKRSHSIRLKKPNQTNFSSVFFLIQ